MNTTGKLTTRVCPSCKGQFQPRSGNQKRCDDCRGGGLPAPQKNQPQNQPVPSFNRVIAALSLTAYQSALRDGMEAAAIRQRDRFDIVLGASNAPAACLCAGDAKSILMTARRNERGRWALRPGAALR